MCCNRAGACADHLSSNPGSPITQPYPSQLTVLALSAAGKGAGGALLQSPCQPVSVNIAWRKQRKVTRQCKHEGRQVPAARVVCRSAGQRMAKQGTLLQRHRQQNRAKLVCLQAYHVS